MPWTAADAKRFTSRANTPKKARQWAAVANSSLARCLARGGSQRSCEGSAIRQANGSIREEKGGATMKTGFRIQETEILDLSTAKVDKEAGVIREVRVLNRERKTGKRTYTNRALTDIARLLEGRKSYADHTDGKRSVRELLGLWGNGKVDHQGGFVTADLKVVPHEKWLLDLAEQMPHALAMSIDAEAMVSKREGKETVHGVTVLHSIDTVTEGGTTHGLFEHAEGGEGKVIETLTDLKGEHAGLLEEYKAEVAAELRADTDEAAKLLAVTAKLKEADEKAAKAEKIAEELQTEKAIREKAEAIDKAILEAKLPKHAVSDVWRKNLAKLDETELKEAIEDRKKLVELSSKAGNRPVSQERTLEEKEEMKPEALKEALTS